MHGRYIFKYIHPKYLKLKVVLLLTWEAKCSRVICRAQSLSCDLLDCSLSASPVHGDFQARMLEWVANSFSRDLPNPGIKPMSLASPALAGGFHCDSATLGKSQWVINNNKIIMDVNSGIAQSYILVPLSTVYFEGASTLNSEPIFSSVNRILQKELD